VTAAVVGGAIVLVVQLRVALGLGDSESAPEVSQVSAQVRPIPLVASGTSSPQNSALPFAAAPLPSRRPTPAPVVEPAAGQTAPAAEQAEPDPDSSQTQLSDLEMPQTCLLGLQQARQQARKLPRNDPARVAAEQTIQSAVAQLRAGQEQGCRNQAFQALYDLTQHSLAQ
jgi:hypothetical protein